MASGKGGGVFSKTKSHKNETVEHFLTKAMLMKVLQEENHKAFMERDIGYGTVDCYDYTTDFAYEVEPRINTRKLKEKFDKYSLGGAQEVIMVPYKKLWKILDVDRKTIRKWKEAIKDYIRV